MTLGATKPIPIAVAFVSRSVRQLVNMGRVSYVPPGQTLRSTEVRLPMPRIYGNPTARRFHEELYAAAGTYELPLLRTYAVDHCELVGPHLVCFCEGCFVYESTRGSRSFRDAETFGPLAAQGEIELLPDAVDLAGTYLVLGGKAGYYHWLTEILPRLFHCLRELDLGDDTRVLMRPLPGQYAEATLSMLGVEPTISTLPRLRVDRAILPTHLVHHKRMGRYSPELPALLRTFRATAVEVATSTYPARIYVSRDDAATRRVANEPEVCAVLARYGFERVLLGQLPFTEQVGMFERARIVVGPHGAGLTNVLFCQPGARLVELCGEGFLAPSPFRNLAQLSDMAYSVLLCEQRTGRQAVAEPLKDADIVVDCEQLERLVATLVSTPEAPARARASSARNGEDLVIDRLLAGRTGITYVDIGSSNPDSDSSTYLHYLAGGFGVCINPNPDLAGRYRRVRPRDRFVHAGVSGSALVRVYFRYQNPVFNTFSEKKAERTRRKADERLSRGRELIDKVVVPMRPLLDILGELDLPAGFLDDLDLLSIDGEDRATDLMRGIDFGRFRPKLIVVRTDLELTGAEIPFVQGLLAHGYDVAASTPHVVYLNRREAASSPAS